MISERSYSFPRLRHLTALLVTLIALASLGTACGEGARPEAPAAAPRGGHLVLIGGGAKPPEAVKLFVALAGGANASIVVLPLASGDSREAGEEYIDRFRALGVTRVRVIHVDDRRDAIRREYVEAVRAATGVFFSGGDQSRIAARLVDTPLLTALFEMKARGGVVGGTSAGTACQSEVMLTGAGNPRSLRPHNMAVTRGIGLVDWAIMDTHFLARHRETRLIAALLEHPRLLGVGVDEATAAWIKPDLTMEVMGRGKVMVYDASEAKRAETPDGDATVVGLKEHALSAGQRFDVQKHAPVP